MKIKTSTPFKMRGFSGFGNSPVKYGVSGEGVIDAASAKADLEDPNFGKLSNYTDNSAEIEATSNNTDSGGDGGGDKDKKGGAGNAIAGAVGDALVASIKSDRSPTVNEDPNEGFTNLKMGV